MAKYCYIPKRYNADARHIVDLCEAILCEYHEKGYCLTLRQLYYQMITRDLFPDSWIDLEYNRKKGLPDDTKNTDKNYKALGGLVSDARLSGDLDIALIEDRGRETTSVRTYSSPADVIDSVAWSYRLDPWTTQINHVEVMVEKDALSGILEPVCRDERVCFSANKGYISTSFGYQIGERLRWEHQGGPGRPGKDIHIIYLGDHDPSGIQMTEDVLGRLTMFAKGIPISVHRIALNMDQVNHYQPPENPAKVSDSRYAAYVEKFQTESSWELDALSPEVLSDLVRRKVRSLRDNELWEQVMAEEKRHKRLLENMAERFREKFRGWS